MQVVNRLMAMSALEETSSTTTTTTTTTSTTETPQELEATTEATEEGCGAGRFLYPVLKMECVDFEEMKRWFEKAFGEQL